MGDREGTFIAVDTGIRRMGPRPAGSMDGSAFIEHLKNTCKMQSYFHPTLQRWITIWDSQKIVEEFHKQVKAGNVPDFAKPENFKQVSSTQTRGDKTYTVTFAISPYYLAVGSNTDYIIMPMNGFMGKTIAAELGLELPTRKMIVDILPRPPNNSVQGRFNSVIEVGRAMLGREPPWMNSQGGYNEEGANKFMDPEIIQEHSRMAHRSLGLTNNAPLGNRIYGGTRKDLLYDQKLENKPNEAIYQFERGVGTTHNMYHVDYSQGIRYVWPTVTIRIHDNKTNTDELKVMRYSDVIKHPDYFFLLSEVKMDVNTMYHLPRQANRGQPTAISR